MRDGVDLGTFLDAKSIGVIGATEDPKRIGGQPIPALLGGGYTGKIYPVNPGRTTVQEFKAVPTVMDLPDDCELALVAVPAAKVSQVIGECGQAGIRFAIVLSAGFNEMGPAGEELLVELLATAKQSGVRIVGPNCQGFINIKDRIFCGFGTGFGEVDVPYGPIALISQSGGVGFSIMSRGKRSGIGFHYVVSSGNEAMVTSLDLLEYFLERDDIRAVGMYLEGIKDGPRFLELGLRALERRKPIVVWKCGNSSSGRRAAVSHTSNVTGSLEMYRAVFREGGFVEVDGVDPMLTAFRALMPFRLPEHKGVAVLTSSGGFGVTAADACEARGLFLPSLSSRTLAALQEVASFGSIQNPIDLPGQMSPADMNRVTPAVLADPGVGQLLLSRGQVRGAVGKEWAEGLVEVAAATDKPIHVTFNPTNAEHTVSILQACGTISLYSTAADANEAAYGASVLADFAEKVRRHRERVAVRLPEVAVEWPAGDAVLGEREAKRVLSRYGVPSVAEAFVPLDEVECLAAPPLAFPLAVKLQSADVHHKTEVGGVRLGIRSLEELKTACAEIRAAVAARQPGARIDGFVIQEMAHGVEMILGVVNDRHFGPVVALGIGGIFTEIFRDVTHRLAPVDTRTAKAMVEELRGAPLLHGARGRPEADIDALADAISRVSMLAAEHAARIAEIDINPLFVREAGQGVAAADALIALRPG